ncbi:hypothetical protein IJ380_02885 [Candidatus Saccharibacteria bacterium]|nr:hypothetical protein [Candidatus Saccharibacteria bacterium]
MSRFRDAHLHTDFEKGVFYLNEHRIYVSLICEDGEVVLSTDDKTALSTGLYVRMSPSNLLRSLRTGLRDTCLKFPKTFYPELGYIIAETEKIEKLTAQFGERTRSHSAEEVENAAECFLLELAEVIDCLEKYIAILHEFILIDSFGNPEDPHLQNFHELTREWRESDPCSLSGLVEDITHRLEEYLSRNEVVHSLTSLMHEVLS